MTYEDFLKESRRIVDAGGQPIPNDVIEECLELWNCWRFSPAKVVEETLKRIHPYRLTIPKEWKKHCANLKAAALQSSRFTRLRQRRGLPFKSRRQP